ncbi:MAG: hypothetical protein ABSH32_25940 [Bryobacteraceae bacterium]|jgi:hypothetical protein
MKIRNVWIAFAVAHCALPLAWAVKPGEEAPDLALRDCSGSEARLSAYLHKKYVAVLARAPERRCLRRFSTMLAAASRR